MKQVVITDQPCHFFRSATSCPLEQITVSMKMCHVPELPYSCIFFIDSHFNFTEYSIYPSGRILSFTEHEPVVGVKGQERNQHLAVNIILYMFIRLVTYAHRLVAEIAG